MKQSTETLIHFFLFAGGVLNIAAAENIAGSGFNLFS